MITKTHHNFHIVDISPWPLVTSLVAIELTLRLVLWFNLVSFYLLLARILLLLVRAFQWWRDIHRESSLQGLHTSKVIVNIKLGIILFIVSEVIFFLSFFWGFFHRRLNPVDSLGLIWPPKSIFPFNPIQIPLLNTIVLLRSGVRITASHHFLLINDKKKRGISLIITLILGGYFSLLQLIEYNDRRFTIADSVYRSCFFIATGFHGFHVIIGTTFLLVTFFRLNNNYFSMFHHLGFELAAWYWHFVDVVWLFLYINIYWWGI